MIIETALVGILIFLILYMCHRSSDMPPGPRPIPVLGNLVQVLVKGRNLPFLGMHKLSKDYGGIMTVRMGSKDIVVLSSYEVLKETMMKDEWCGRLWNPNIQARYLNQRIGIIFLDGDAWKEQRRFTIRHLRDFGFGKQALMEKAIHDELDEVTDRLGRKMGSSDETLLEMRTYFNLSVLNVLWFMIAGTRYSHDDAKLISLIEKAELIFKTTKPGGLALIFPFLAKLFPKMSGTGPQLAAYADLHSFFRESIRAHRKSESYGSSAHFMDIFLQEIEKDKSPELLYSEDQLIALCTDLFVAGSETTSSTLAFAILYLILNPDVQEKLYREIVDLVGTEGRVSLEHQSKLPYTEATIMEIHRRCSIAPFTPPHRSTKDISYRNYKIPKDTIVFVNLYSLNMDEGHWGDPEVFRPERFLNADGLVQRDEHLIPFGMGKRVCLGESLAKMTIFLYLTTLVKKFKFETVPGQPLPTTEPLAGMSLSPKPYQVIVKTRQ